MPSNLSEEKLQSLMRQSTVTTPGELFKAGTYEHSELGDGNIGPSQAGTSVSCGAQNDIISTHAVNDSFENSDAENNAIVHTSKVESRNSCKDDDDIPLNETLTSPFSRNDIETDVNVVSGHGKGSENDDANNNRYTQESEL